MTALWNDAPERFDRSRVRESWLARTPIRRYKPLAVLGSLLAMRQMGRSESQWTLASSHLFAHHARFSGPARRARRYAYVYTPARYIWAPDLDERGRSALVRLVTPLLRRIDRRAAQRLTSVAVISRVVQERVRSAWGIDAAVIYPPVDVDGLVALSKDPISPADLLVLDTLPTDFLLGASRFVGYKNLDKVIRLGELTGLPVVIAGDGPLRSVLVEAAARSSTDVQVVLSPSRRLLVELYGRARAFVFPPEEDFGIMPVEAMALGTPVVGLNRGGTSETVEHLRSGVLIDDFSNLDGPMILAELSKLKRREVRRRANEFSTHVFARNLLEWLDLSSGSESRRG